MSATAAPRGLSARVLCAYAGFRASMAAELRAGRDEPRLLAYAMGGCLALFLAALPRIFVTPPPQVAAAGEAGVFGFFLANLVSFLFLAPLFLYGVAAAARLVARAFGGAGGWRETRLATFWSLLVAAPALLLSALAGQAATLLGAPGLAVVIGMATGVLAAWIWSACLAEAHGFRRTGAVFAVQLALAVAVVGLVVIATRAPAVAA